MSQAVLFAQITKVDEATQTVSGRAVQEVVDRTNEVFDYETSKPNFEKWSQVTKDATGGTSVGNLRAMHGKVAAGKLTEIEFHDDEKAIDIVAKVVDANEWKKVQEGVYTGFSIGGEYVKKWDDTDGNKRYTADPSEISLVDRPCVPTATFFQVTKADGSVEQVAFKQPVERGQMVDELIAKGEKVDDLIKLTDEALVEKYEASKVEPVAKADDQPTELEVEVVGTDGDVIELGKVMGEHKLTVADTVQLVKTVCGKMGVEELKKLGDSLLIADPAGYLVKVDLSKIEFGDTVNKKYPLSTEDQIKAAWSFINKDAAASIYSEDELTAIKANITKAWQEKIDVEGPKELDKAAGGDLQKTEPLKKGLWSVVDLAGVVNGLNWVLCDTQWEAEVEGDGSQIPARLAAALKELGAILVDMTAEEIAELTGEQTPEANVVVMELADAAKSLVKRATDLEKVGARNSKTDLEKIQSMHDNAVALGAECTTDDDAEKNSGGDLEKVEAGNLQKLLDSNNQLQKTVTELTERLAKVESQPAPYKSILRVVSKGDDVNLTKNDPGVDPVAPGGNVNEVATLIKGVHAQGGAPLAK